MKKKNFYLAAAFVSSLIFTKTHGGKSGFKHFRAFLRNGAAVGACTECSGFVARRLIEPLLVMQKEFPEGFDILEAGAGFGPVTRHIVSHLRPQDRLFLVELGKEACDYLKDEYADKFDNIELYQGYVQDWELPKNSRLKIIVSTIPLLVHPTASHPIKIIPSTSLVPFLHL